ncbi:MAG: hypothetical protein IPJ54_08340 [Saprospiraceae bacterium]|nr:hypothetical protein [Saprospiraceae bacterium]
MHWTYRLSIGRPSPAPNVIANQKMDQVLINKSDQELTWQEHIRKRPGMYLGQVNHKGFIETFKKFISQFLKLSGSDLVDIKFKNEMEVEIIFFNICNPIRQDIAILNMGDLQNTYDLPILNSLSENMLVNFCMEAELSQNFNQGKSLQEISNTLINCSQLKINYVLDKEIYGTDFKWNSNYLTYDLIEYFYLNSKVKFEITYLSNKKSNTNKYEFENGLSDRLDIEIFNGIGTCYLKHYMNLAIENFKIEVAFAFRQYSIDHTFIKTYVNSELTPNHGSHLEGVRKGISNSFRRYLKTHQQCSGNLFKELNFRKRLVCFINIRLDEPIYYGSTRQKLTNPEIIKPISKYISNKLLNLYQKIMKQPKQYLPNLIKNKWYNDNNALDYMPVIGRHIPSAIRSIIFIKKTHHHLYNFQHKKIQ